MQFVNEGKRVHFSLTEKHENSFVLGLKLSYHDEPWIDGSKSTGLKVEKISSAEFSGVKHVLSECSSFCRNRELYSNLSKKT